MKPLEQLPTERDRYAIGGRFNKRLNNATLRLEQRFYIDTWGVKASSTDSRYMVDLSRHLRVWPHGRAPRSDRIRTSIRVAYYRGARRRRPDRQCRFIEPATASSRRSSRGTGGGGARLGIGEPEGDIKCGITIVGQTSWYTRFLNALYVTTRTAVYGSVGFDVEF